jgi:hypothetical protein
MTVISANLKSFTHDVGLFGRVDGIETIPGTNGALAVVEI